MSEIKSIAQLRELYVEPSEKAKNKVLASLDRHSKTLIENSHFVILSTTDADGFVDISPKGGTPGFVKVLDDATFLVPDSSGNNRLDSLQNILTNPKVGLLFMVDGIDEVVRVKGTASISNAPDLMAICPDGLKAPKVVIKVAIESLYFHCAKAVMRGKLWSGTYKVNRSVLPSLAEIIKEQQELEGEFVSQEEMVGYYKSSL
ncbi:pyridoxamine 5'-phosphate oxidase family protein [Vibrio splendidus]|uniref:pyridoxamine 5'-phosphate oxidase family protein n=1 Tax=Vibrio splendidus TaxID=29497 RepID=UPI000C83FF54|nr:pyridoxamine 5'-phosphate oxidase family protein [Vibrio splendidus]PMJ53118.1 phosphohydrolase [Vibrio splendidus]